LLKKQSKLLIKFKLSTTINKQQTTINYQQSTIVPDIHKRTPCKKKLYFFEKKFGY